MKNARFACSALVVTLAQGCATITSNEVQPLSLTTESADGTKVEKASCTLRNDKGSWTAESPGFVPVRRSSEDLLVECKKEGLPDGALRAISRAAAGMFGNIIFGGVVGAVIDHAKGTGYNYPDRLPVRMGASVTIDRFDDSAAVAASDSRGAGLNSGSSAAGGTAQSGEKSAR
jgi:hypothetical protein